ncbi:MAG: HAD-IIIC family phosphatase [Bryobacterales bacterium]|nr:HAD-IIIC family phosphatase [Bryobacterales bacterium]
MELRELLIRKDPLFWPQLREQSGQASNFETLISLCTLRKRAEAAGLAPAEPQETLRIAFLGGCSLYPLNELARHMLSVEGYACEVFTGDFDNYVSEIMDEASALYRFAPQVVFLLPSPGRCKYQGRWTDARQVQQAQAVETASQLLDLCRRVYERTGAEVLLSNFILPGGFDPGAYRTRTLASDWSFRKMVNLELGLNAPPYVHLCDLEFLAYRRGATASEDARGWFETKQPCAPDLLADIAKEIAVLVRGFRKGHKKVLVLDLDNTLWGGVVGDDGLEGIEIGDTSPRGEAFKTFQRYILSLAGRGILLAVSSKNDHEKAIEPFDKHPEMVLRPQHFVSFKANWNPKSENIREMAAELNLGLDSFVFVDDNPAEIEIVRQFLPEVSTILLGPDPAAYTRELQDSRYFEPRSITAEDAGRTAQYRQEAERRTLLASATDMDAYLASLEMEATLREFNPIDAPRIAQLINKSNQFNLTTRRRTEAEVLELAGDPGAAAFTIRLRDRFGDHGLIAVIIAKIVPGKGGPVFEIDTWLMSCRVLKRQVEQETLNEIARLARLHSCAEIRGVYIPTAKNGMVRDLYPQMGFRPASGSETHTEYLLDTGAYEAVPTQIRITGRSYESRSSHFASTASF